MSRIRVCRLGCNCHWCDARRAVTTAWERVRRIGHCEDGIRAANEAKLVEGGLLALSRLLMYAKQHREVRPIRKGRDR